MSTKKSIILVALLLMVNGVFYAALADHDEHKERKRYQKGHGNSSEHDGKRHLKPVDNPTYKEICGDCHFAYQPELLPSSSWEKIIAGLSDHHGEEIDLDQESKKIIAEYLKANSAEYSSAKPAVKIMRSLKGKTPMRITDVPYIRHNGTSMRMMIFQPMLSRGNLWDLCQTVSLATPPLTMGFTTMIMLSFLGDRICNYLAIKIWTNDRRQILQVGSIQDY